MVIQHTKDDFAYANPVDIQKYVKTELAIKIENALKKGEQNAIRMKDLKIIVGGSNRKIRLTIEDMRLNGHVILSSENGYWYAENSAEFERWYIYMYSYIQHLSHVVKSVGDSASKQFNKAYQPPLFIN